MIVDQEDKFKKVLAELTEKPMEQNMFNKFLELYPKDWKKLKVTFSKFNRSKQFGRTIPLQRPEVSLRKAISIWLQKEKNKITDTK